MSEKKAKPAAAMPKQEISIGQANYEAFSEALGAFSPPGPWVKLPARAKAAWEKAAEAVLMRRFEQFEEAKKALPASVRLPGKALPIVVAAEAVS